MKGSMNVVIKGESSNISGVLYAISDDSQWKYFAEINELSDSRNNPYYFDYDGSSFYLVVVDTHGAGSGEGVGKLFSLKSGSNIWNLETCFYYTPELDLEKTPQGKLREFINGNQEIDKFSLDEINCNNVSIKQLSNSSLNP
jgi:hypothetical protein